MNYIYIIRVGQIGSESERMVKERLYLTRRPSVEALSVCPSASELIQLIKWDFITE